MNTLAILGVVNGVLWFLLYLVERIGRANDQERAERRIALAVKALDVCADYVPDSSATMIRTLIGRIERRP